MFFWVSVHTKNTTVNTESWIWSFSEYEIATDLKCKVESNLLQLICWDLAVPGWIRKEKKKITAYFPEAKTWCHRQRQSTTETANLTFLHSTSWGLAEEPHPKGCDQQHRQVTRGVWQRVVLGPVQFNIFTNALDDGSKKNATSASLQMLKNCTETMMHQLIVLLRRHLNKNSKTGQWTSWS